VQTNTRPGPAGRAGSRRDGYIYAFLFLVGVLPYLNTLWASFVYDDNYQIVQNPYVRSFHYLKQILTTPVWSFKYARIPTNYYRPLMSLEYLVLYKVYGPLAYVFHLANVLAQGSVVILLYAVTRRLFDSKPIAFVAALLFALHPVHTEAVAWVAAVPDLQLAAFLLITFWFYLDLGEPERNRWWTPLAMTVAFFLALFSKEPAVAFPVIALFYEYALRADRHETHWKQKLGRYGPLFLATGVYLVARVTLIGGLVPKLQHPRVSWPSALLSSVSLFGQYMNKLVWPATLKMFYWFNPVTSLRDPAFLIGEAWIVGLGLLCGILWRRNRVCVLPIFWTVATLAPALNARWMPGNVFAERYLYVPSIGFCWLTSIGVLALWDAKLVRPFVWARVALASIVLLALSLATAKTVKRNEVWHDDLAFFKDGVRQNPDNANLRSDLGFAYWSAWDNADAIEQWNISLAKDPENFWALNNLGMALVAAKHYTDAVPHLRRALDLRPEFSDAHVNLAEAFKGLGRDSEAQAEFQAAIDSSPLDFSAHNHFGAFYQGIGRTQEAKSQYLLSVAAQPNPTALDALGDIALANGETAVAESSYRQAAEIDLFDSHAHYKLVLLYSASGRAGDALREFDLAQRTDPGNDPLGQDAKAAVSKLKPAK
jgi:protein O-mannosyl-transferase